MSLSMATRIRPSLSTNPAFSLWVRETGHAGGKLRFAYRVILQVGDARSARIADAFDRHSEPPGIDATAG